MKFTIKKIAKYFPGSLGNTLKAFLIPRENILHEFITQPFRKTWTGYLKKKKTLYHFHRHAIRSASNSTHCALLNGSLVRDKCLLSRYRKTSNIRRTLVGNKIVDHSNVVGASPVGAAPTTSSFST